MHIGESSAGRLEYPPIVLPTANVTITITGAGGDNIVRTVTIDSDDTGATNFIVCLSVSDDNRLLTNVIFLANIYE